MEVEANLPPLDLLLRSLSFRLARRARSSGPEHLLHDPCRLARAERPVAHASPLHRALHSFPKLLPPSLSVERLVPNALPPWSPSPSFETLIAPSQDEGLTLVDNHLSSLPTNSLVGYSDDSLLEGSVGAASVLMVKGREGEGSLTSLRVLEDQQTVWAGEAEGARLTLSNSLTLLRSLPAPSLSLLVDNQALLLAPTNPLPTPGQHLRLHLRDLLTQLNSSFPALRVCLVWCPGHRGVAGNEEVDQAAKRAAEAGVERVGGRRGEGGCARLKEMQRAPRSKGRPVVLFRASQETVSSVSSEGSKYRGGGGETSWLIDLFQA